MEQDEPFDSLNDIPTVVDDDTDGVDMNTIGHESGSLMSPLKKTDEDSMPSSAGPEPSSPRHSNKPSISVAPLPLPSASPQIAAASNIVGYHLDDSAHLSSRPAVSYTEDAHASELPTTPFKNRNVVAASMSVVSPFSKKLYEEDEDASQLPQRRNSFSERNAHEPQENLFRNEAPSSNRVRHGRSPSVVSLENRTFLDRNSKSSPSSKGFSGIEEDYIGALCTKLGLEIVSAPLKTSIIPTSSGQKSLVTRKDPNHPNRQYFRFHPIHARNFGDSVFFNYEQIAGLYRSISMFDAFDLERMRLDCGISPQARDNILHRLGLRVDLLDINRHIIPFEEKKLTFLNNRGQTFKYKSKCAQCQSWLFPGFSRPQCHYCYQYYCSSCMSAEQLQMIHFKAIDNRNQRYDLCKTCTNLVSRQNKQAIDIRSYAENKKLLQGNFVLDPTHQKLTHIMNTTSISRPPGRTAGDDSNLMSMGEFPKAGILASVPTMERSPPIESILFPPESYQFDQFWRAPSSVDSVTIYVCLSDICTLHKIRLIVDSLGYTPQVAPCFSISTSFHVASEECFQNHPDWNIAAKGRDISPRSALDYHFNPPVTCRIVRIKISLPDMSSKDEKMGVFLHLGSIRFYGTYFELSPHRRVNPLTKFGQVDTKESQPANELKILPPRSMCQDRVQEFTLEEVNIRGFTIELHPPPTNPLAQVKLIRVFLISRDITPQVWDAGIYIVPRATHCKSLKYNIPEIPGQRWAVVSFEVLETYGEEKFVPPKISLW